MKKLNTTIACLFIFLVLGCKTSSQTYSSSNSVSQSEQPTPSAQLYTAYNIWVVNYPNFKCINYKFKNNILPVGTRVQNVIIDRGDDERWRHISFQTVENRKTYKIYFVDAWHPGKTVQDYKEYMFTTKNFEKLTEGLTEKEIRSIKAGHVVKGMSKRAVLITYGYPPEHRTPSLDGSLWIYWRNRFATFGVCFDDQNMSTGCL